jgi:hypothetical protein
LIKSNLKISLKELQLQKKPLSQPLSTLDSSLKATPISNPQENDSYDDDDDIRSVINHPTYNSNRPKTIAGPVNSKSTPTGFCEKDITPKERMLMNKLKRADEEAIKMGQLAKENYEERMLRQTFRRETTIHNSVRIVLINCLFLTIFINLFR